MPTVLIYMAFIFRIIQQPAGEYLYFSLDPSHMTQSLAPLVVCNAPASHNIMLLIESSPIVHKMQVGERIYIEGRNGREAFVIESIDRFTAATDGNPWDNFRSERDGKVYTAQQIFMAMYCNPFWKVNIQTCYDGLNRMMVHAVPFESWGRLSHME